MKAPEAWRLRGGSKKKHGQSLSPRLWKALKKGPGLEQGLSGGSWGAFGALAALRHCSPKVNINAVTVTCLELPMGVLPAAEQL